MKLLCSGFMDDIVLECVSRGKVSVFHVFELTNSIDDSQE
jgi:hypothetical protein